MRRKSLIKKVREPAYAGHPELWIPADPEGFFFRRWKVIQQGMIVVMVQVGSDDDGCGDDRGIVGKEHLPDNL
jgi:hypothetical protein